MAPPKRWLAAALALTFLCLVLYAGYRHDPDFWRSAPALFKLAREAEKAGDLARALALGRRAYERDPGNSGYGTYLGWLYLKVSQPETALTIFGRVWEQDPRAVSALKGLAQALEVLGKRGEALEQLAAHLKTRPDDTEILAFAAELAAKRREDRDLAVIYYQRLYQLTGEVEVRRQLVDLLTALGRFAEAIPLQEEEAAQFPENREALEKLALLHYWQRDYQGATEVYKRLLEWAAEDARLRQQAAHTAEAAQNIDEALKHYLWLYARYQGKKDYALPLARLWSQKGQHAEAVAVLAPLMQEKPEPELRRWYALELLLTGDYAQARQAYAAAWEEGDTHKETIINLARLYGQQRQFHKAAAMWDEAGRRQLLTGELRWEAALAYSYAQRYREAVGVLQPVPRGHPDYPRLQVFLGQMHFYQKHWGEAARYFRAYLEKQPEDVEVRRQLAEALAMDPETQEEALRQYGELLKRRDDVALRHRRLALLLEAGRWQEAQKELQACPLPQEASLLREQARLHLWVGNLEEALSRYDRLLAVDPRDRQALLEKARTLVYLRRSAEALEVLRMLRLGQPGERDRPRSFASREARQLLVTAIAAELAQKNWPAASDWALRLFCSQFPERHRLARDWKEAWDWLAGENPTDTELPEPGEEREGADLLPGGSNKPKTRLSREERTWVARVLCHFSGEAAVRLATQLLVENLWENRHDHATLLLLSYLLPKLPRFEELSQMVHRIPGVRVGSPEYVASLAFFDSSLGRHGGKLDYLLHVLNEYRRHKWPDSPGELMALADLAMELGEAQVAAGYYRQALKIKPHDQHLQALLLQCELSRKEWGKALATLEKQGGRAQTALERARLYLWRGQYEGVKAAVADISPDHPDYVTGRLLMVQALRLGRQHQEALAALEALAPRLPPEDYLMEKAQILEALGDKGAAGLYAQIIGSRPDSQAARVATARRSRALGNWAGAYKAYAQALRHAPQDIELLNELEYIRQQLRPQVASRGFAYARGERRPEEALRPWQFSRFDREPRVAGRLFYRRSYWGVGLDLYPQGVGLTSLPSALLWNAGFPVQPEAAGFSDSNRLYGGIFRLAGSFWITKVLPISLGVEYREYNQGKTRLLSQESSWSATYKKELQVIEDKGSRLRRAEVSIGAGPVNVKDTLRLTGEIILRRYWKRTDHHLNRLGYERRLVFIPFPPHFEWVTQSLDRVDKTTHREDHNRLVGSLEVDFSLTDRTEAAVSYSRRDLLDQDANIYPRLYQQILNLSEARLTTYHQISLSYRHQFRPGLEWRGTIGGALFSDENSRFTLYQGVGWRALSQPRMHLELTPHFYLATYSQREKAYFSPREYLAMGLGLDFDRQLFRLPTLILQGTAQAVGQNGRWGPALHGLAALELEWVQNFYTDFYCFYFREWVDNYRLLTAGASFRLRF